MIRLAFALCAALLASSAQADTLFTNVNGVRADSTGGIDRFTGMLVGNDGKVKRLLHGEMFRMTGDTKVIDVGGRALLPGLIDAHGHIMGLGFGALQLDLVGTSSVQDLQGRLRAYVAANPGSGWISGRGWNQELWPDSRFPSAADLDAVVANRPVVLERVDGHAVVINSAALKAARITAATKDPVGGKIERDSAGKPTGLLIDSATELVGKVTPPPTPAERDRALSEAQRILLGFGITAAADMGTSLDDWAAMNRAGETGALKVRIMAYAMGVEPLKQVTRPTGWLYADHLRMGGVKLYDDGALGSRGAWLKAPYTDMPSTRGLMFHSDAELLQLADTATSHGFQVATHAIGDAANAQVIATYEKLAAKYPGDRRWRIEHFQIVDPVDIPRLKPAGIIASMQPTHQTSDRLMAEKRLGPDRLEGAYAWQTVERLGIPLAFGSDFPVESPNPFPGLSAAISRQDPQGQPPGGWRPQERLSFAQALAAFTRTAAYAGFADGKFGTLEPGEWADFIVVDRDPSAVNPQSLAATKVLETWIAGTRTWSASKANAERVERGQ